MADQQPESNLPLRPLPPETPPSENLTPEIPLLKQPDVPGAPEKTAQRYSLTQKQRHLGERLIEGGIRATATLSIVFIFLIFFYVFRQAAPIFFGDDEPVAAASGDSTATGRGASATLTAAEQQKARQTVGPDYPLLTQESRVRPSYLAHDNWQPNSQYPRYGIYPIIVGTLKTTFVALLIAIPLSILAALYSAFFAPKWVREYLKPAIEVLAGFPSVVLGFFCLMTVATLVQMVFGVEQRLNAVVGGIGLALAVIPIIYTISDDALRSVPQSLREAALALGASEWQAAYKVMLPAATPGILAAVLLGLGRAFGETMIALLATGNAGTFSWNFFESVRTFAATIGAEMGEVVYGSPHYQVLFLLGVLLFVFSFLINLVTEFYIKARLIKRFRGEE
jgi:phosphate transport system permease protein